MRIFQTLLFFMLIMANARAMKHEEIPFDAIVMDRLIAEDALREGCAPEDEVFFRTSWIDRKNRERDESYHPYYRLSNFVHPSCQAFNYFGHSPNHAHVGNEGFPIVNNFNNFYDIKYDHNFVHPNYDQVPPIAAHQPCSAKRKSHQTMKLKPGNCENCDCTESTIWRIIKMPQGNVTLCNACGLRAKKNKYCEFCSYIYYDNELTNNWVKCIDCAKHAHFACFQENYNNEIYICDGCSENVPVQ